MPITDWNPLLRDQFEEPYWPELQSFVAGERARYDVYPPDPEVFAALHLTSFGNTRVVILGQDPYHGPGQAHGLCFSVREGVRVPPSLVNIHKELHSDLGLPIPDHGNLEPWARQGVLLPERHADRTGEVGRLAPRQGMGDVHEPCHRGRVGEAGARRVHPVGGTTPGGRSRSSTPCATRSSSHRTPSPFSANNGFFGSRPFSRANEALVAAGRDPVDWDLTKGT